FGYCFVPGATPSAQCDAFGRGPAYVARVGSVRWYVGNNARGGRSLFRATLSNRSSINTPDTLIDAFEVVEVVVDMAVTYLENGEDAYTAPAAVSDWGQVVAVRIQLDMVATEGALSAREIQGTDAQALRRTLTHVVQLRNREAVL